MIATANPPATHQGPGKAHPEPPLRVFANQAQRDAAVVREVILPSCLWKIINDENAGSPGTKLAFDSMMSEAGDIKDPIEKMLVEQLILLHFRLATLQVEAAEVHEAERVKAFNGALARLLGEFRRLALALRIYRAPASAKAFTVVHQQNVAAAGGSQQVRYQDDQKSKNSLSDQSEMNGNGTEDLHELRERVARGEKSQAGDRGTDQRSPQAAMVA
jgi:hypothetical protein